MRLGVSGMYRNYPSQSYLRTYKYLVLAETDDWFLFPIFKIKTATMALPRFILGLSVSAGLVVAQQLPLADFQSPPSTYGTKFRYW